VSQVKNTGGTIETIAGCVINTLGWMFFVTIVIGLILRDKHNQ
jgi:hypothetical protein